MEKNNLNIFSLKNLLHVITYGKALGRGRYQNLVPMGLEKKLLEKKFVMFRPFQKTWFHPFIHSSIHPSIR
jgi:hypothetical protein